MSVRDTAATATQAKTTSCSVGKNDAGNGFDETSEFVTAASSLATGVGIQDWLDEGSGPASKRQERPKWSLQTESEMHVQRLEAKLASLKKAKAMSRKKSSQAEHLDFDPESQDMESEEILAGQEESDEGLWLLWNSHSPHKATSSLPQVTAPSPHPPMQHYGTRNSEHTGFVEEDGNSSEDDRAAQEERLEQARQKAKHVDQYTRDTRCCATCSTGCIIS